MPDLFGPSGPEKAINFWLTGRAIAAFGLVAVVVLPLRTWSPLVCLARSRRLSRSAAQLVDRIFPRRLAAAHLHRRQGLTPFKVNTEYALAATYFLVALFLVRRGAQRRDVNLYWLAAGSWTLGLAELFFTLYGHVTDVFNLLGTSTRPRPM